MKLVIIVICLFCGSTLFAQSQTQSDLTSGNGPNIVKNPADTVPKLWHKGAILSFNLSQTSLSNWAAGGDDFALALTTYLHGQALYKKGKNSWDNTIDINLAYLKTTSTGPRKNDDRIDILSKYGYALNPTLNLAGLFNFHSQFFKGYTYNTDGSKTLNSDFLAPAYVLIGAGFDYHPAKGLSIYISPITVRWIIVNNDSLSSQAAYGVDTGKTVKTEVGAFATIGYTTNLNKIVSYTGRLDLFSNYEQDPQDVAIAMSNLFVVKLSKVLSATYSLDLIYDDNVRLFGPNHTSPGLQSKSMVGVGLLVKL